MDHNFWSNIAGRELQQFTKLSSPLATGSGFPEGIQTSYRGPRKKISNCEIDGISSIHLRFVFTPSHSRRPNSLKVSYRCR